MAHANIQQWTPSTPTAEERSKSSQAETILLSRVCLAKRFISATLGGIDRDVMKIALTEVLSEMAVDPRELVTGRSSRAGDGMTSLVKNAFEEQLHCEAFDMVVNGQPLKTPYDLAMMVFSHDHLDCRVEVSTLFNADEDEDEDVISVSVQDHEALSYNLRTKVRTVATPGRWHVYYAKNITDLIKLADAEAKRLGWAVELAKK